MNTINRIGIINTPGKQPQRVRVLASKNPLGLRLLYEIERLDGAGGSSWVNANRVSFLY